MMNYNTYLELLSSNDFMDNCIRECLNKMYELSEPSITLDRIKEQNKNLSKEEMDADPTYKHHYLPSEVFSEVLEHYADVYGFSPKWGNYIELLTFDLLNGGRKSVYKKDETGECRRTYEEMPKLSEVIGNENAEKVKGMIDDIKKYYHINADYQSFSFNVVNYSPSSNKEAVEQYWREHGKSDYTINEDKWFKETDDEENEEYNDECGHECL